MEYRAEGETVYTSVTTENLTNLAPGVYYVRYKATEYYEASDEVKVEITASETPEPLKTSEEPETPKVEPIADYDENVAVEEKEQVIVKTNTDKKDVAGSTQRYLFLQIKPKTTSIKLTWKKIKGADGYMIYGGPCGKNMERITTIKKASTKSWTAKKLKKNKYYKYMVVAYRNTAEGQKAITTSKSVHAATDGGKRGNPEKIKLKKSSLSVKVKKTAKIKAFFTSKKKVSLHIAKFRYESENKKIATVNKNGVVTGVNKGKTVIYVYTQNGLCKKVKVTVK